MRNTRSGSRPRGPRRSLRPPDRAAGRPAAFRPRTSLSSSHRPVTPCVSAAPPWGGTAFGPHRVARHVEAIVRRCRRMSFRPPPVGVPGAGSSGRVAAACSRHTGSSLGPAASTLAGSGTRYAASGSCRPTHASRFRPKPSRLRR